jgi:type IV secretory pathway VirB4 component
MPFEFPALALMAAAASAPIIPAVAEYFSAGAADVSLKRSRRTELGLVDYLPYEELLEPDLLLTTYGALGAMFEIVWNDTSVESDEAGIRHCAWLNDALRKFGAGWMVQTYTMRVEAQPLPSPSFFASDAARVLAESHATFASANRYDLRHLVAVTYLPPSEANAKARNLVFSGESPIEATYEKVRATFERGLGGLEDSLRRVCKVRRLGEHPQDSGRSEFLEAIFQVLYDDVQPIRLADASGVDDEPFEPFPIGGLLAARDVSPVGLRPKIGEKHLRVLSVYGAPASTHPGMMEAFLRSPVSGCRFATRSIFQEVEQAKAKLDFKRRAWTGQRSSMASKMVPGGGAGRVNRYAAINEEQTEEALLAASMGRVSWVHFSAKAVFFNADIDALTAAIREVRKALQSEGFTVNEETLNTVDAYFGHVPFDGHHDVREGQVHTANVGRIWPSSSRWAGRKTWNCKHCGPLTVPTLTGVTDTGEDFFIDPHDEEDTQSFVAIGAPGCGKTSDLNTLAANYRRAPNDQVFAIDKNRGQLVTCMFLGGDYRENARYSLFDGIEDPRKLAFRVKFLSNLAALNKVPIEAEQRAIIKRTLELMVNDASRHRSLSTFLNLLSPVDRDGKLASALAQYAEGGVHRGIFDGIGSERGHNSYEVHELGGLLGGMQDDLVAAPVLIWILNSFEDRLPDHRSIVLVDEAWAALKSPLVAALLEDEMRTLRFRHAGIGFYTHSLAEVKDSTIGKIVFTTCKTRLLYPNPEANGEFRSFFESLDLNGAQIDVLKNGVLKRDCNLSVNGRFGAFRLRRSPAELAVYGCTGLDEIAAARRLMTEYPEDWRERHLRAYGCDREAEQLRSLRVQGVHHSGAYAEALAR